ncbi:hypothetical protein QT196_39110 (plasmid) [Streptomyces sp. P9-2B-2]|uniref:hypothetical protein n=1 Tax=Streptomyces sp. P9-2B-2 TaxID=3057114 RepID=UPI0025B5B545|nr:hypothetical protein [Streptomyces sp. P9-2B-2]WJY43271.1 hypothetical protein QT196_39110 [Streptomyces sp. P9-2B-2]
MRPATAAEALHGLIRVRPYGWLASPLPTNPAAAAERLHKVRDQDHADHPAAGGPLEVLAARATAAVAALGEPPAAVLKVHADPDAFNAELLAYALVGHSPVLPRLLGAADASRSLLLEHLSDPFDWAPADAPAALVDAVAAVHAAPAGLDAASADALAPFRLDRLTAAPAPAWISDLDAWHTALTLCIRAYGSEHVPVGHLDLKPEHVRHRRGDGAVCLIDIETLRPDVTGLIDLITLPAVLRQAGHPIAGPDVRELYRAATARHGAAWTTSDLRAVLIAYQRATSVATLSGLAD